MGGLSALDARGCGWADKGGQAAHGTPRLPFSRKYRMSLKFSTGDRISLWARRPIRRPCLLKIFFDPAQAVAGTSVHEAERT